MSTFIAMRPTTRLGEVWLTGVINDNERSTIMRSFDSGEFFVAEQVGIPPLYRELFEYSGGRTEDDHAWHAFEGLRSEQNLPDDAKVWGTVSKLAATFAAAQRNWKPELSPNFVEW
ncbi:MAG: hypothetical protein JJE34_05660 [Alphaproteobacteria bacterium]|nr:hypothetical protein [Alphaproteobacteria bacterium]